MSTILKKHGIAFIAAWVMIVVVGTAGAFNQGQTDSLIFFDDFSQDEIGIAPSQWRLSNADGEYGSITVIDAPELESGKAVRVVVNPHEGKDGKSVNVSMRAPWGSTIEDAPVMVIDHKVRWIEGDAMYSYVTKGSNRLLWYVSPSGALVYNGGSGSSKSFPLSDPNGWHHVRLIADREQDRVYVFLNDMTTPVMGPLPFLRAMDSWLDANLIFSHWTHPKQRREIHYAEFEVKTSASRELIEMLETDSETKEDDEASGTSTASSLLPEPDELEKLLAKMDPWEGVLRPSDGANYLQDTHGVSLPFYQAVPIPQGRLHPAQLAEIKGFSHESERFIPAVLSPATMWPDGTVQWLAVDGMWPGDLPFGQEAGQRIALPKDTFPDENAVLRDAVHSLDVQDDRVRLLDHEGTPVMILTPRASYINVTEPKVILPDTHPDDERQYAWAEPLDVLHPNGTPKSLNLRIREHIVEKENDLYTVFRLRGDGGQTLPGSDLEWQMRVRIYKRLPLVRLQMTWGLHWDPNQYALTRAEWVADFTTPLRAAQVPGVDAPLDLSSGAARIASEPTGKAHVTHAGQTIAHTEWPVSTWDAALVELSSQTRPERFVGLGTPRFTRLGPNHISLGEDGIVLASWSEHSGYGLDLRITAEPDEFGMATSDATTNGVGVMNTLETSLVWGSDRDAVLATALFEAKRDFLWLPSRDDVIASGVLGPWSDDLFENNEAYLEDLQFELHFLLASRDRWRWNGWANFGDMRTNFSRGSNPDRGLHPERWSLYGRYGWRKGSGDAYYGLWIGGLALEDRDVALAALDYALHVANVDMVHGRFFGSRSAESGGMHRRNKDHWSGSAQMQYSPSAGLYLSQWLTGHERIQEALGELREYARTQGGSGSAYAASAWIHRFRETLDPRDLALARTLLDQSALAWERRGLMPMNTVDTWGNPDPNAKLTGLAALYQNNFRLPSDGLPVLIQFYEATRDQEYLEAIATTLRVHGMPTAVDPIFGAYHALSYLLLNGFSDEDIGIEIVSTAQEHVKQILARTPEPIGLPRDEWTYDTLMRLATKGASKASLSISSRAKYALFVLGYFGRPTLEVAIHSPREGVRVQGVVPVRLEWVNPQQVPGLKSVSIEIDGQPIFRGTDLPGPEELSIDTSTLDEGSRQLVITTDHAQYGVNRQIVKFIVTNQWSLVQNMNPPVTQGWFGTVDFLQTDSRSMGWSYETGRSHEFYGDPQRLVRATNGSEYLIWKTPRLKTIDITAFVRPGIDIRSGLELAVSSSKETWTEVTYMPVVDGSETTAPWRRVRISVDVDDHRGYEWFRLTLNEGLPADAVQIGEVKMTGLRD